MEEIGTTKDVRDAVSAELKFDPLVDDADIHVVNVSGDVALNGTVPSYPQYLEAAAAAQRVGGVKNVHNHLQVVLSDADVRDDAMLTTAANNALTQNVIVPDGVEAAVEDGNVTLTGTVGYGPERAAAERAVSGLIGLRNVRNDIEISYDVEDPVGVDLHVQEALARSALVPGDSDVEVATKDGIITLTGHVRTWAEHDAVIDAAWMARGVIDVRDELQITG
jgi:osmotically-inducible protein OsmY